MEEGEWPPAAHHDYRVESFGSFQMEFDNNILRCKNTYMKRVYPFLFVWVMCIPAFSNLGGFYLTARRYPQHAMGLGSVLGIVAVETLILLGLMAGGVYAFKRSPRSPFHSECVIDADARTLKMGGSDLISLDADITLLLKMDRPRFLNRCLIYAESPNLKGSRSLRPAIGVFFNAADAECALQEIAAFTGLKSVNELRRRGD